MKLALLTRNAKLYSHLRLIQAAKVAAMRSCRSTICAAMQHHLAEAFLALSGTTLDGFDAVIPRIAASRTFFGLAVLRQFEMMGVLPAQRIGGDRAVARQAPMPAALARDGVGLPVTAFANDTAKADEVIEIAGGAPVVIKLLEGTQGIGVVLGETHKSAKSMIEAFHGANTDILVQEFIREAVGPRHPRLRDRGQGGGGDGAAAARPAISAPTCTAAARREAVEITPGSADRASGGPLDGPQCGRRRHAALADRGRW